MKTREKTKNQNTTFTSVSSAEKESRAIRKRVRHILKSAPAELQYVCDELSKR